MSIYNYPPGPAFPPPMLLNPMTIPSNHQCALGDAIQPAAQNDLSTVWPSANRALLCPVEIAVTATWVSGYVYNGSSLSGNLDIGILDWTAQTLLASTGSTPQTGSTTLVVPFTAAVTLQPGLYYMAIVFDNITATTRAFTGTGTLALQSQGFQQVAGAFPLTGSLTLATPASAYCPVFGIMQGTVL